MAARKRQKKLNFSQLFAFSRGMCYTILPYDCKDSDFPASPPEESAEVMGWADMQPF